MKTDETKHACVVSTLLFLDRAKKIESMDDKAINDLALQLEDEDANGASAEKEEMTKKLQKKKAQIQRRLEAEERKSRKQSANNKSKKGKKNDDDDDDDDDALLTFAKGSRPQNKKKK